MESDTVKRSSASTDILFPAKRRAVEGVSNSSKNEIDEFLIFGYEARIFNDAEKAKEMEVMKNGKYLIPWRNDDESQLMMDRYDVRHLLDDLSCLKDKSNIAYMDQHEKEFEEERYLDLDSEEELLFAMSEDERESYIDEKRNRRKMVNESAAIAYSYTEDTALSSFKAELVAKFKSPANMILPDTQEQVNVIVGTAKHVAASKSANLVEIKTQVRHANDPLYAFLNRSNPLHSFYKHIIWISSTGFGDYGDTSSDEDESSTITTPKPVPQTSTAKPSITKPASSEIEETIDKTAKFVARAGEALEARIRQQHPGDARFAFLNPWNEYHTFYKHQVEHYKNAGKNNN